MKPGCSSPLIFCVTPLVPAVDGAELSSLPTRSRERSARTRCNNVRSALFGLGYLATFSNVQTTGSSKLGGSGETGPPPPFDPPPFDPPPSDPPPFDPPPFDPPPFAPPPFDPPPFDPPPFDPPPFDLPPFVPPPPPLLTTTVPPPFVPPPPLPPPPPFVPPPKIPEPSKKAPTPTAAKPPLTQLTKLHISCFFSRLFVFRRALGSVRTSSFTPALIEPLTSEPSIEESTTAGSTIGTGTADGGTALAIGGDSITGAPAKLPVATEPSFALSCWS